jgi:DNA topoisomerase-2
MAKKIEDKYIILDKISHILLRPGTYVGSNKPHKVEKYLIEEGKIIEDEVVYIPSFIKIFDEVITNSVDEHKRNPKLNKIEVNVDVDKNIISVEDNGGIEVQVHKVYNKYVPEVIFGNLMSGSNYDDTDQRTVAGLNGLGAKLTNVFSSEFEVSTCDGEKKFVQTYKNNMRERSEPNVKTSRKKHTKITYKPDLSQFGMEKIDNDHFRVIMKRVYDLAACNTSIKFYFNGELINLKSFRDYISLYREEHFYEESKDKNWSIGVGLSESGFQQVSFANSTETYDGGTHVDYILDQIVTELRAYFKKKHKYDVKPSELKNHIFLFLNCTIINPSFSSQTKEKLNTETEHFGSEYKVSDKLIKSILGSEIVNSILDWIEQKKKADERKLERELNKKVSKIKVDKLIDAKGKNRLKCSLGIFEGDSAAQAFRKYRDSQTMGSFSLKGKFINVSDITTNRLVKNKEAVNLMAAIGLKIGSDLSLKNLRYGRILIYTDADTDGNSIAGLLINFFYKYWPEMFERKMVYKVETPIVVVKPKKGKKDKIIFYRQEEYDEWEKNNNLKDFEIKYKKGLAALVDDEYENIINEPKLTLFETDKDTDYTLKTWFGKDPDLRKKELLD